LQAFSPPTQRDTKTPPPEPTSDKPEDDKSR
jgi:hypothetical protein